jgi:hypothetical protein
VYLNDIATDQYTRRIAYYAAISYYDEHLGMVLDTLEACGKTGSTAILMAGDHGWHLGERNMWEKKGLDELDSHSTVPWIANASKGIITSASALASQIEDMRFWFRNERTSGIAVVRTAGRVASRGRRRRCPQRSRLLRSACSLDAEMLPSMVDHHPHGQSNCCNEIKISTIRLLVSAHPLSHPPPAPRSHQIALWFESAQNYPR